MKTSELISYFEFSKSSKQGIQRIKENEISIAYNVKNSTYYFRVSEAYDMYNRMNIGQANGNLYFVLNKEKGLKASVKGSWKTRVKSTAYPSKEAVTSVLKLILNAPLNKVEKVTMQFDIVEKTNDEVILKFIKLK